MWEAEYGLVMVLLGRGGCIQRHDRTPVLVMKVSTRGGMRDVGC